MLWQLSFTCFFSPEQNASRSLRDSQVGHGQTLFSSVLQGPFRVFWRILVSVSSIRNLRSSHVAIFQKIVVRPIEFLKRKSVAKDHKLSQLFIPSCTYICRKTLYSPVKLPRTTFWFRDRTRFFTNSSSHRYWVRQTVPISSLDCFEGLW